MIAYALAALVLAAQPAPGAAEGEGPLQTAPKERSGADLDAQPIPPAAKPTNEQKTAPAAAKTLTFETKTLVDGGALQVIRGQRATFRLNDKNQPVLVKVEDGKLAEAHPDGEVKEAFEAPPAGAIAVAFDSSAQKRAAVLKVWNGLSKAVDYRAIALVYRGDKLTPVPVMVCAVPPRSMRVETWRAPIVAMGLARFKQTVTARACK